MSDSNTAVRKAILVVDDKPDTCAFMQAALEAAGYEVRTAPEGAPALALQRSRPADLLITDLFMPGQEGMDTIGRFKQQFPDTKIIAMSAGRRGGTGKHDFLSAAALVGADATLRKPFTADQLLDAVRGLLR